MHQDVCCMAQPATAGAAGAAVAGATAGGATTGGTAGLTKKRGGIGLCLGLLSTIVSVGL